METQILGRKKSPLEMVEYRLSGYEKAKAKLAIVEAELNAMNKFEQLANMDLVEAQHKAYDRAESAYSTYAKAARRVGMEPQAPSHYESY